MPKTFLTSKEQMKTDGHQGWPSLFNALPFFDVLQNGHLDEIPVKLDLTTTLRHFGNSNYKL